MRRKLKLKEMQDIAESRGGKCLSKKYVNNRIKLKWICEKGHEWKAAPSDVKSGKWCPYCARNVRLTIEEMQQIAKERGGACLSTSYTNQYTPLKWKCEDGHIWEAKPANIKSGNWCPICVSGRSERICRYIFEKIFNEKFPKKKPKWLIHPERKSRMELDGFCEKLGIAFEYHGRQHYKRLNHWFQSDEEFQQRQKDDTIKMQICKQNGFILIIIPHTISSEKLPQYIIRKLQQGGMKILNVPVNIFDYKTFSGIYSPRKLKEMQEIAKSKGGKCLSSEYVDDRTKLKWRCKEGHEWEANPDNIVHRGRWCPRCGGTFKLTLEEMQEIAKEREGDCLSTKYINQYENLSWKCKKGHIWEASPNNIKHGKWCPYCAGKYQTIKNMQELAKKRGGVCLSKEYRGAKVKLEWKCNKGHIWKAWPSNIKSGKWCPYCATIKRANARRLTIEEMHDIAEKKGGECLSNKYIGFSLKLKWRCKEGHEWEAIPGSIKRGSWCPYCVRKKGATTRQRDPSG